MPANLTFHNKWRPATLNKHLCMPKYFIINKWYATYHTKQRNKIFMCCSIGCIYTINKGNSCRLTWFFVTRKASIIIFFYAIKNNCGNLLNLIKIITHKCLYTHILQQHLAFHFEWYKHIPPDLYFIYMVYHTTLLTKIIASRITSKTQTGFQ